MALMDFMVLHWRCNDGHGLAVTDAIGSTSLAPSVVPAFDDAYFFGIGTNANEGTQYMSNLSKIDALVRLSSLPTSGERDEIWNAGAGEEYSTFSSGLQAKVAFAHGMADTSDATGGGHTLTNYNAVAFSAGHIGNATDYTGINQGMYRAGETKNRFGFQDWYVALYAKLGSLTAPNNNFQSFISKSEGATAGGGDEWEFALGHNSSLNRYQCDFGDVTGLRGNAVIYADVYGAASTGAFHLIEAWYEKAANTLHICIDRTSENTLSPIALPHRVTWTAGTLGYGIKLIDGIGVYDAAPGVTPGVYFCACTNVTNLDGGDVDHAWAFSIKLTTIAPGQNSVVFGKYNRTGTVVDYIVFWNDTTNVLEFQISDGGGSNFAVVGVALADTNEHFVYCWFRASDNQIGIRLDGGAGALTDTDTVAFTPVATSTDFRIGAAVGDIAADNKQFEGSISSISRWRGGLPSTANIDYIYNSGAVRSYDDFVAAGSRVFPRKRMSRSPLLRM